MIRIIKKDNEKFQLISLNFFNGFAQSVGRIDQPSSNYSTCWSSIAFIILPTLFRTLHIVQTSYNTDHAFNAKHRYGVVARDNIALFESINCDSGEPISIFISKFLIVFVVVLASCFCTENFSLQTYSFVLKNQIIISLEFISRLVWGETHKCTSIQQGGPY